MQIKEHNAKVFGQNCKIKLMHFNKKDRKEWRLIFNYWKKLKLGLRNYKSREPNFPEGLSEVAFCLWSGSARYINLKGSKKGIAGSFDTFDLSKNRAQQIKACSVKNDLTSFGPKSKWDDLYFLDFYNDGEIDGLFDVYKIPNDLIYNQRVNERQTFKQQQAQGRRPRFSLKTLIATNGIVPLGRKIKI